MCALSTIPLLVCAHSRPVSAPCGPCAGSSYPARGSFMWDSFEHSRTHPPSYTLHRTHSPPGASLRSTQRVSLCHCQGPDRQGPAPDPERAGARAPGCARVHLHGPSPPTATLAGKAEKRKAEFISISYLRKNTKYTPARGGAGGGGTGRREAAAGSGGAGVRSPPRRRRIPERAHTTGGTFHRSATAQSGSTSAMKRGP